MLIARIILVSALVFLFVGQPAQAAGYQRFTIGRTVHQGPAPESGFAVWLSADSNSVPLGSPLWITVELSNATRESQGANFNARNFDYDFLIRDRTGGPAPKNRFSDFGLDLISGPIDGYRVGVGQSMFVRFQLASLYSISEAGTYDITLIEARMKINGHPTTLHHSNTISVTVTR